MTNIGKKKIKSASWFEAHIETMVPAIEEKRKALAANKIYPREKNYRLYSLRVVMRNDAPDAVQMNSGLTSVLVFSLVLRQVSSRPYMYDGIKQALGPSQNKTAPLKLLQAG